MGTAQFSSSGANLTSPQTRGIHSITLCQKEKQKREPVGREKFLRPSLDRNGGKLEEQERKTGGEWQLPRFNDRDTEGSGRDIWSGGRRTSTSGFRRVFPADSSLITPFMSADSSLELAPMAQLSPTVTPDIRIRRSNVDRELTSSYQTPAYTRYVAKEWPLSWIRS